MSNFIKIFVLFSFVFLSACSGQNGAERKDLLIYCGITMIKPMKQLAEEFEKTHPVNITITQGGSQDLYDSLKMSQIGDLYLPGSPSYRTKNAHENLLKEYVFVGYNRVAMMVQKGNPLGLNNDINHLINPKLKNVLCNPETGSIGRASEKILIKAGINKKAYENSVYMTSDSRRIIEAIKNKDADVTLNWYAAGIWEGNREHVDIIELPKEISTPKALELNLLSSSKHPEEARAFMDYASSKHGLTTFKKFGFLTDAEYQEAIKNK